MTVLLSISSFAGTTRTLVAVGTLSEPSIDCTTLAATPRNGSTVEALGVTNVGIGLTTGSAGFTTGVEKLLLDSTFLEMGSVIVGIEMIGCAIGWSEFVLAN
jgi:hypothetical protein